MTFGHAFHQMIERADSSRGDAGDGQRVGNGSGEGDVESSPGAVPVHGREEEFARAKHGRLVRKGYGIDAGRTATAMGEDLPFARTHGLGIDRHDYALAAEALGGFTNEVGVIDGSGLDGE